MSDLANPIFHDENKAREWLEAELWPGGPVCPHCHSVSDATLLNGKSHRPGLHQCNSCRRPFTVTVGTLYERSKIPLNKWLHATHLLMASKKGMSALQVGRMLGLSKKTAWFVCHRIRESLRVGPLAPPMGSGGAIVEADETYIGKTIFPKGRSHWHMRTVLTLVERGGHARSFHVDRSDARSVMPVINANIEKESRIMTDASPLYATLYRSYTHESVNHKAGEYVRGAVHTNTVEGYFSIFKRGMRGVYQHCSEKHLHRYLAEFDFRYNHRAALGVDDKTRMKKSVQGIVGKRLTYRRPRKAPEMTT